jgi:hypothetical protein
MRFPMKRWTWTRSAERRRQRRRAAGLDALDEQLIDRLAGRARGGGLQLAGEGGLLQQLSSFSWPPTGFSCSGWFWIRIEGGWRSAGSLIRYRAVVPCECVGVDHKGERHDLAGLRCWYRPELAEAYLTHGERITGANRGTFRPCSQPRIYVTGAART